MREVAVNEAGLHIGQDHHDEELRAKGMDWPEVSEALGIPGLRDAYKRLVAKNQQQEPTNGQ